MARDTRPPVPRSNIETAIDRTIETVIDRRIETAAARLGGEVPLPPQRQVFIRPKIHGLDLVIHGTLIGDLTQPNGPLRDLLANPPRLRNLAAVHHDGRKVPIAIVVVRGPGGETRRGIEVRLRDRASGHLLDRAGTSRSGVAVLRYPVARHRHGPGEGEGEEELDTVVELADGSQVLELPPPGQPSHRVGELTVERLADLPADLPFDDDPFGNLPSDFTTEVCDLLDSLEGTVPDPLFGGLVPSTDFRSQRGPLLKEVSVVRLGPERDPRRYLVRLRQSWSFRGYTLGELADVTGLDPGAVVSQTGETVRRTTEQVARNLDRFVSNLLETTTSTLSERASVDTLIKVATSVDAGLFGGGFFLPPFALGGLGVGADVSARTRSSIDTSLDVNARLQVARSLVNESVRTALSSVRNLETTLQKTLQQVSPLLSRVTNLLRWIVYENYAVCTDVDDIHEIVSVPLFELPSGEGGEPVFPPEHIVRYRPFFEPALLDPSFRGQFDVLRRQLEAAANANTLTTIHMAAIYSAVGVEGDLRVSIGGREAVLPLRGTATIAQTTLRIPPVRAAELGTGFFTLTLRSPDIFELLEALGDSSPSAIGVTVSELRFWFDRSPAADPEQVLTDAPLPLSVNLETRSLAVELNLTPPDELFDPAENPLFLHINQNRSYYLGLLGKAALRIPSLRFDAPQLEDVPPDVWRLPIIGFEGHKIVVLKDADPEDPFVTQLLADPGAATVIQIAAPGAYAEALQGVLSLTDAVGKIHPNLLPAPAPVLAALPLQVIGGGVGGVGGGGGGLPLPIP